MKRPLLHLVALLFATQTAAFSAQTVDKPAPRFTLAISEKHEGITPTSRNLLVTEKNISSAIVTESGCPTLRGWYNVSVVHDGVLMEETDAVRRIRKVREDHAPCHGSLIKRETKTGESMQFPLNITGLYDVSKPGTSEITVSKETDPDHPEKSVTIKSNTITIFVAGSIKGDVKK